MGVGVGGGLLKIVTLARIIQEDTKDTNEFKNKVMVRVSQYESDELLKENWLVV